MTPLELALTILSETATTALHQTHDSQGMGELSADAQEAGEVGGAARQDIESRLGHSVISAESYKALTARATQPSLFGQDVDAAIIPGADDEER
jgi:hypothetical protein